MIASALTFVALPGIWLVNREDGSSTRPNVAAAGAAVDGVAPSSTVVAFDPMGTAAPQYLDGRATPVASSTVPAPPAVGSVGEHVVATARAIFRRSVTDDRTCLLNGVEQGARVTVVNVDNDLSVTCFVAPRAPEQPEGELVLSPRAFAKIADPTAAPIDVEIRQ